MGKKTQQKNVYLLLHNIRSVHNVGSIFRTADAAGVTKIYLTGYTPRPIDRFGRPVKELSKVALGGELSVEWEYYSNPLQVLRKLKGNVTEIIGIEQDSRSIDYKKVKPKFPVLFIVGNEVEGMPKNLLKKCDVIAEIPMKGKKESLNVGVSLGIALFRILNV
jgi:23S rRNA (guanosine2251-2'-O)-methyltransferase